MRPDQTLKRLKTIEGHMRGVIRMVEEDSYCIDVIRQIQAVQSALNSAELRQRMQDQGVELKFIPADEFAAVTEQEFRIWGKVVETAKVKLD